MGAFASADQCVTYYGGARGDGRDSNHDRNAVNAPLSSAIS